MPDTDLIRELSVKLSNLTVRLEVALAEMKAEREKVVDGKAERQALARQIDDLEGRMSKVETALDQVNKHIAQTNMWLSRGVWTLALAVFALLWQIFLGDVIVLPVP